MRTLLVVLGAAIGAPARFVIDQFISKFSMFSTKPYGIFVVNILGSFIFGLTMKASINTNALFAIGFAGAFTTWSTFMLDFFSAYELRRYSSAAINLAASIGFGILAAALGLALAQ